MKPESNFHATVSTEEKLGPIYSRLWSSSKVEKETSRKHIENRNDKKEKKKCRREKRGESTNKEREKGRFIAKVR